MDERFALIDDESLRHPTDLWRAERWAWLTDVASERFTGGQHMVRFAMSTVARVALGLVIGYAAGAALGFGAVHAFSGNIYDRDLEAVMTAAFATGPLGAALGVAAGLWMARIR